MTRGLFSIKRRNDDVFEVTVAVSVTIYHKVTVTHKNLYKQNDNIKTKKQ